MHFYIFTESTLGLLRSRSRDVYIFSRPGQSQGLLFKHLCDSLIKWVSHPLVKIFLRRCHSQTVENGANYIDIFPEILNLEGIKIAVLIQRLRRFCWMGWFCLPVELHRWGLVPSQQACLSSFRKFITLKNEFKFTIDQDLFDFVAIRSCPHLFSIINKLKQQLAPKVFFVFVLEKGTKKQGLKWAKIEQIFIYFTFSN